MDRIGRYRIVRELGHGAMGVVYHAIDPNIGRPVALKTIRLGEVSNAQERARLKERLFREARSAGMLSHPGIVTIYDVDQQGELAYIAMEFVDGPTLDEWLSGTGDIAPQQLLAILGQTSVALDYAHAKGIVHRDIKPANIMIDPEGSAKIADFGIAKITTSEQFTMTGTIVGTPHYMAPEQVQGKTVDGRADQFALAVIAFEMLTGEKPFTGEQLTTVVYKIVAEEPPSAQRLNGSLSPAIEGVLRKGLSKKPESRYRSCQEFVDALESACGAAKGWKAMPRGGSSDAPTFFDPSQPPKPPAPRAWPPPRPRGPGTTGIGERRRVGFFPLALAILMAAGLVGLIAWQAAPWLGNSGGAVKPPEAPVAPAAPAAGMPPGHELPDVPKPSAMGPAKSPPAPAETPREPSSPAPQAAETKPASQRTPAEPVFRGLVPIIVPTNPPDAVATFDGRSSSECRTPCTLMVPPGRHTVAVTLPGHFTERREIEVGSQPQEIPLISLHGTTGTLMLSTTPPGAGIFIDGRAWPQTTPAQISLTPGTYTLRVEKNGRQATERIEIRSGTTAFRKIPLEP